MVLAISHPFLLLVLTFFSLSVWASPHPRGGSKTATLELAVKIGLSGIKSIADTDRVRVRKLLQPDSHNSSIDATNAGVTYTANIGVGNPPTYYILLVDTGSSNTWIGANQSYVITNTSQDTGSSFGLSYGSGSVYGKEYLDTITLNSDLIIKSQSIGVAEDGAGTGLDGDLDGIFGVGPIDLTEDTVNNTYEVPTAMDNLHAQHTINSEVLGVFFAPASATDTTGELTFGDHDTSKITGGINYVPITMTYPANTYWGIDQSISYGAEMILGQTAGIVDTGTTLIFIATDAFERYQAATNATLDPDTGLLKISSEQYNNLSSLYFNIGVESYELTPNAQIWPRSLNTVMNGTSDGIYLIVSDIGSDSGSGLDFVIGYCFLERFYSVFDTTNSRVGFATTNYTNATTN